MFDRLVKLAALILLAGYLFVYYESTLNGRYKEVTSSPIMLDTRTGELVRPIDGRMVKIATVEPRE